MAHEQRTWLRQILSLCVLVAKASLVLGDSGAAVAGKLSLGDTKVVLRGTDGSAISSLTGQYPKPVLANPQIPAGGSLDVTFSVTKNGDSFKPQQAMLMLKSKSLGLAAYAVGKAKGSSYTATINAAAVAKQVGKLGGEYEVTLLVGDPSVEQGLSYALGTAEVLFPPGSSYPEPAAAVRTAAFQPINNAKPAIAHIFRPPEKRPPAAVSYVFAALAFVPLVAVLLYVPAATGVNFKAWTVAPLYSMLFHGGLAGMLLLYFVFWLRLNLAQTLPLAGLWGVFVAGAGYLLLSSLSSQRLKKQD